MITQVARLFLSLVLLTLLLSPSSTSPAQAQACAISGLVFRDYNASGARDALEPGQANILVTAYDAANVAIATATSDATGAYTLSGLPAGQEVRVEFTIPQSFLRPGRVGTQSVSTVEFVTCGQTGSLDLGVSNPADYCTDNPRLTTSCYTVGYQLDKAEPALVSFDYNSGSSDFTSPLPAAPNRFDGPIQSLSTAQQIGTTWGLAYQRVSDTLFTGAFMKRHAGFGPGGPGAIYRIRNAQGGAPAIDVIATLNAGTAPHPTVVDNTPANAELWLRDANSWDAVGKIGLGDLDIADDGSELFVVNLFDRNLYRLPLNNNAGLAGGITNYSIPFPASCPDPQINARPFALNVSDGLVYIGVTCTAESLAAGLPQAQITEAIRNQLRAYVYAFDPASTNFTLVFEAGINYQRLCANNQSLGPANCMTAQWQPWTNVFRAFRSARGPNDPSIVYAQPWLTDIEFDRGDLILGFRDRYGDQTGNMAFSPVAGDNTLYLGITAGDMLRACQDGAGGWTLENNGTCGPLTTGGANDVGGPGGGEFYFGDKFEGFHDELFIGGLVQVPGRPEISGTFFDPIPISDPQALFDGGVRWLNNVNPNAGDVTRAFRIYAGALGEAPTFGKANGLGDLEVMCPPAPIQIGNRVWFDADNDGVQDPGEPPVPGVTVRLYIGDVLVAETVTNANGEYYFDNLDPDTDYNIRLDNPADYAPGGPLANWFLTVPNVGDDQRDSDGILINGFPRINLRTGSPGDNNHTYDFGFSEVNTPVTGANISLVKSVDNPAAAVGDLVTYSYVVTNTGNVTLQIETLFDDVLGLITLADTTLDPGESTIGTATQVIEPGDLPLRNIASVLGRPVNGEPPVQATDEVVVGGPPGDGGTSPVGGPGAPGAPGSAQGVFRKSVNPPFAQPGADVTWTITLNNPNTTPLTNISVTDSIPDPLEITGVSATSGSIGFSGRSINFTQDILGPGASVTITIQTRFPANATNTAFILTNAAVLNSDTLNLTARAQVIRAGELVRTGETPWWRWALAGLTLALGVAAAWIVIRRRDQARAG